MLYRIIYSCVQSYKHRRSLARYASDGSLQVASVLDLSPPQLLQAGIKCLIIDFDGVLAAHAKMRPISEAEVWLRACCAVFQNKVFILSNKPTLIRKHYFTQNFKEVTFVTAKYKKPFPQEILHILSQTKLLPTEIMVIDDRLCTGILAAAISNVQGCLITKPYTDYSAHPVLEWLYCCLRRFEQWLFKP